MTLQTVGFESLPTESLAPARADLSLVPTDIESPSGVTAITLSEAQICLARLARIAQGKEAPYPVSERRLTRNRIVNAGRQISKLEHAAAQSDIAEYYDKSHILAVELGGSQAP